MKFEHPVFCADSAAYYAPKMLVEDEKVESRQVGRVDGRNRRRSLSTRRGSSKKIGFGLITEVLKAPESDAKYKYFLNDGPCWGRFCCAV